MSWDDEDFDVPAGSDAPVLDNWDDENDDPLLEGESWDFDEDAEKQKKLEEKKKKKEEEDKKLAAKNAKLKKLKEFDEADSATRKQMLKTAELDADLNNAADLFGGLGVADEHPRAKALQEEQSAAAKLKSQALTIDTPLTNHPLFQPTNKQEYERLRKALVPVFEELAETSAINYSGSLTVDLIRDISKPLSVENIRKVISTLNVVVKDKERAERQARLAKTGGTSIGGAGKKKGKAKMNLGGGFKKEEYTDTTNYGDFDDDDFM